MRATGSRLVMALVLFGAAATAWAEARTLRREADVRERLATLRDSDVGSEGGMAATVASWMRRDDRAAGRGMAASQYWRGSYDALASSASAVDRDPDPAVLLVKANASFRAVAAGAQPRQEKVQQLDSVLQAYATVLKSGGFAADAAYNYEFAARLREALARGRGAATTPPGAAGKDAALQPQSADLPTGPTIHGHPGGPPPRAKGEQFNIIAPMDFGDREAQPEPNAGGRPLRKG